MSRIYFHAPGRTEEVGGPERAYAGGLADRFLELSLGVDRHVHEGDKILELFPDEAKQRILRMDSIYTALSMWIAVRGLDGACFRRPGGSEVPVWQTALNTMLMCGNDALKLLARMHGQCEIHAYVEGPNRAWLAEIIRKGRGDSILRPNMGWDSIVEFLEDSAETPVVTSYSVTEQWPDISYWDGWIPYDGDNDELSLDSENTWYNYTEEQHWELTMDNLRNTDNGTLEMSPDKWNWPDYFFGQGETGFSLVEKLYEQPAVQGGVR